MMRAIELMLVACALMSGLPAPAGAREYFHAKQVADVWVKDFESLEPANCKASDVAPSHSEARQFFRRAKVLDKKTLDDNYPTAPCQVIGTLKYRSKVCEWTISAAGTGSVTCGSRTWWFACDACDDLLVKPALK